MCTSTKLSSVGVRMVNYYMGKIRNNVNANDILETCDRNGFTHMGCGAIYKQFKSTTKLVGKGLHIRCLPNPHWVLVARQILNLKLQEHIGKYYSINDTMEILPTSKAKTKGHVTVSLNNRNLLFVNVEHVQHIMVELYDITPEGINSFFCNEIFRLSQEKVPRSLLSFIVKLYSNFLIFPIFILEGSYLMSSDNEQ